MTETIQKACHLLMETRATEGDEESFLSSDDRENLIGLLNKPLLDEVIEERVLRGLCCNVASCSTPQMSEEQIRQSKTRTFKKKSGTLKDLTQRLQAMRKKKEEAKEDAAESQTDPEVEVNPQFCCETCDNEFATKVKHRVDNTNESSLHLLGGTPSAPFSKLKSAARILKEYSDARLSEKSVFQRLEKRNIEKLLVSFW